MDQNPYKSPEVVGELKPVHWRRRMSFSRRSVVICKLGGVAAFIAAMPMNVVSGHGAGFISDHNHFQGYEVVLILGVVVPLMGGIAFIPITLSNLLVLGAPLFDFRGTHWLILTLLVASAFFSIVILGTWEAGVLAGYWVWSAAVLLSFFGVVMERLRGIPKSDGDVNTLPGTRRRNRLMNIV